MGEAKGDLWVFAYGSLMWQPGFPFAQSCPALLKGYHRDFCIASLHYRGTRRYPGLVLGLDRGGTCRGIAYRIEDHDRESVLAYLRKRELIYGVYREALLPVALDHPARTPVLAVTYVAERRHPSYRGRLGLQAEASIMRRAKGGAGTNLDYLLNTLEHLRVQGIRERRLERLVTLIGALAARGVAEEGRRARSLALSRAWAAKDAGRSNGPADGARHRFCYRKPRGA